MADTTYQGVQMRTVIGWMAALFASALLGAAVYQTVLSKPATSLDPAATVETVTGEPGPQPTLYRTEVRTIVEPTPTVTVEEEVLIAEDAAVQPAAPAPTRTSSPRATPRATAEREDDNSTQNRDDDADRASTEAEDDAEDAAKEAEDRAEAAAKQAEDAAEAAAKEAEDAAEATAKESESDDD